MELEVVHAAFTNKDKMRIDCGFETPLYRVI